MAAKGEHEIVEVCGQEVGLSNPGKLYFPERRPHQAGPGRLLPGVRAGRRAPPARAPDGHEALGRRRRGRALLPEARARQRARVAADRHRHVPQRPPRARAGPQRRGAPGLGREPGRDRLEPVAGAPLRPRPPRRAARRPRPGPDVPFDEVRQVALGVREVLEEHGLVGFPKTSGSRGIHIYVRLQPEHGFEEVRRAALALAREVERRMPGRATSRWWKEERARASSSTTTRTPATAPSPPPTPSALVADARVSCPLEWERGRRRRAGRAAPGHRPRAAARARRPVGAIDEHPASSTPARAGGARRARGARRRAVAAALPQAEGRAAARAAQPREGSRGRGAGR
jgi:hypothetical protein